MRRFLFVNATHPDDASVSALRVACLGRALARQGHEVYLLTRQLGAGTGSDSAHSSAASEDTGAASLRLLEEGPGGGRFLHLVAFGQPTGPLSARPSRLHTAMNWLRGQSSDPSWVRSVEDALCNGLGDVRIDLVWATFTPIECWTIADRFARARGIPFVADIKDNWRDYVPLGLRRLVAGRAASARSLTANSSLQWAFFPRDRRPRGVIYSGYWRDRLDAAPPSGQNPMLTGVFFGRPDLSGYRQLVDAMKTWAEARQRPLRLRFFGARHEEVQGFVPADGASLLRLEARPFLPPERLMDECRRADFNFYVRHPRVAIHHKATELMAAGRPILVWGAETAETSALAERVGVAMYVCRAQNELSDSLDRLSQGSAVSEPSADTAQLEWLTWENQAARLLEVFGRALNGEEAR